MAKAILVMNMPETCENCLLCVPQNGYCVVGGNARKVDLENGKADWSDPSDDCPLVEAIGYVQPVGNMISWEDEE